MTYLISKPNTRFNSLIRIVLRNKLVKQRMKTNNKNTLSSKRFEITLNNVITDQSLYNSLLSPKIIECIGLRDEFITMRQQESLSRPDFMFVEKNAPKNINPIYSSFVLELLELGKNIEDKHIGKLIHYNREILSCNPTREFII